MSGEKLSNGEVIDYFFASKDNLTFKTKKMQNFEFVVRNLLKIEKRNFWGWKEPNTMIFLDYLIHYFPALKFSETINFSQ